MFFPASIVQANFCLKMLLFFIFVIWWAGFEVVSKACCGTGTYEMSYLCDKFNPFTCKDANKYVFWDSFHPSEKSNQLISEHILPHLLAQFFWFVANVWCVVLVFARKSDRIYSPYKSITLFLKLLLLLLFATKLYYSVFEYVKSSIVHMFIF